MVAGKGRQTKDRQSHLRLLNGIWHVQLKTAEGKRKTMSLQTTNRFEAELRVGQGLAELKRRTREQAIASAKKFPADAKVIEWDVDLATGEATATETTWAAAAPDEELIEEPGAITWREVTRVARERRIRLHAKDYSRSWYEGLKQSIDIAKKLNLNPEDMESPKNCLAIVRGFEKSGASRTTVTQRVGILQSALTGAKKSGEYPQLKNAFSDIDFRSHAGVKSYEEPTPEQLEILLKELPNQPRHHRLAITLMLVTGARIGAATGLVPADLDDEGCWLVGKGKPRYWVPLPGAVFNELEQGFEFASAERVRVVLREIVPVKPHGLRHLYTSLGRQGGVPLDAQARLMDHSLPASMTQMVYGEWPHDRLRMESMKVWKQLGW